VAVPVVLELLAVVSVVAPVVLVPALVVAVGLAVVVTGLAVVVVGLAVVVVGFAVVVVGSTWQPWWPSGAAHVAPVLALADPEYAQPTSPMATAPTIARPTTRRDEPMNLLHIVACVSHSTSPLSSGPPDAVTNRRRIDRRSYTYKLDIMSKIPMSIKDLHKRRPFPTSP
jgi:hypothetical protein